MNRPLQILKYLLADALTAAIAWWIFYIFRKTYIEPQKFLYQIEIEYTEQFYNALVAIPVFWLVLYFSFGYYYQIYRKSRLREVGQTLLHTVVGVTVIFFVALLDDTIATYTNYYQLILGLFVIHFVLTIIPRLIITTISVHQIHNRRIGFPTLLIGSNAKAAELFKEIDGLKKSVGFMFKGYLQVNGTNDAESLKPLKRLGSYEDVHEVIAKHNIEEVIIAIESQEHSKMERILNDLHREQVGIKVIPDLYDILSGSVKMSAIFGLPLIDIRHQIIPYWQRVLKRALDIVVSIFVMIFLSPMYLLIAILVKMSSKGSIFYSHERIGIHGKPFQIYKFRSMRSDAEANGPQLSSEEDPRITPIGKWLRKLRLDEFPQFYNVLIGDMSMVGPRPERQFFIDQIVKRAPHYHHLHRVRPGITSWGQVKYGYAENVDEMIERLKYDILYIENMTLMVDLKILIYTVLIVLQGRGK